MPDADSARRRLLDAAVKRFGEGGALGVTLDEIRREAGVSVGAVYHHFPDKAALHAEAWLDVLDRYREGFLAVLRRESDAEAGVRGVVAFHLKWVAAHREAAALLFSARPIHGVGADALRARNAAFFEEASIWWKTHVRYGALRELEVELVHALWLGPSETFCRGWLAGRVKRVPPSVTRVLADAAWRSLRAPRSSLDPSGGSQ